MVIGPILAFLMKTLLRWMTSIIICNGELMKILTKKLLAKKLLQAYKRTIIHKTFS
jgi:hypothetical protein